MEPLAILAGCLLMMVAVIATAGGLARFNSFYRQELARAGSRELTLDGLRGLAALLVAAHHAAITHTWLLTQAWAQARSPLPQLFGPAGVLLFFMLTGYLFWGKARAARGRMNPLTLWRGRFYRIAPLYFFSLVLILILGTVEIGGGWLAWDHWDALLRLLGLGMVEWHHVGNLYPSEYNANVLWTLWYEWRFYLLLPFLAWLATDRKIFGLTATLYLFLAAGLVFDVTITAGVYFILGAITLECLRITSLRERLRSPFAAAAALLLCAGLGILTRSQLPVSGPNDTLAIVCLPVFVVAAAGNTLFGFLIHPAMRCLGAISFSLYLLHGILFKFVGWELQAAGLNHLSLPGFWLVYTGVAVLTTGLCAVTYRWIEFPFLTVSHRSGNPAGRTK